MSDLLARLIEAGTPAALVAEVAQQIAMAEARIAVANEAIESRRAKDRERQQRRRSNVTSRDVTVDSVTERDPSLSRPLSPQTPLTPTHTHPDNKPRARKGTAPAKPEDVSDQVWSDFLTHRKAKCAPVSATVIAGFRRQAEEIGWTLEAAMAECVSQGWQGFKADWVKDRQRPARPVANDPGDFLATLTRRGSGP